MSAGWAMLVQGNRVRNCAFAVAASVLVAHPGRAEVIVDDEPPELPRSTAVASDLEPASVEEIARELLQLQQQMGGSVVDGRAQLQDWNAASGPVTPQDAPAWSAYPPLAPTVQSHAAFSSHSNKVHELREAAWQLDTTAHRLEKLDLYDQADALRGVASRLRRDARELKQHTTSSAAEGLKFMAPSLPPVPPQPRVSEPGTGQPLHPAQRSGSRPLESRPPRSLD